MGVKEPVDWKSLFMRFMRMYGEETNDWLPECWEEHGITKEEALEIFKEYEKTYPDEI